jgi:hypothetical protein
VPGAVYNPALDTVPPVAVHVTAVFELPVTVAVNCCVTDVCKDAEVGLIEMLTTEVTVTVALADFVVSAALVAVTVYVPAVPGAV